MRSLVLWAVALLAIMAPPSAVASSHLSAPGWQVLAAAGHMPSFYDPAGVAIGPGDTVYVADVGNNRILKLASDGRALAAWPLPLLPAGQSYFHVLGGQQ